MNSLIHLARLISVCREVTGRKKLQKIVHLLQAAGHHEDFGYEFGYLHYGPYAHGVKHDLESLNEEGLVIEEPTSVGEHQSYMYKASNELGSGLASIGLGDDPSWAGLARDLNKLTPQRLEAASTIVFLRERGFSSERLKRRFDELKPSLAGEWCEADKLAERVLGSRP